MQYELSNHAIIRAQQRGILIETIEMIVILADRRTRTPGGTVALSVSDKARARWINGGLPATTMDRAKGIVLIADPDTNTLVTVEHTHGRRRRFKR
jgi:hypothetical protein